jgi:DNA polymerase-1
MSKIYLIDWNSFIYRMFFALPEFSTKDWKIVNAVFWMAKFFVWQLINEKPDYIVFIKDAKWDNFRHQLYSEYKATRERMPDNLRSQIKDIEEMIAKMWIDIIEIPWFEADDVIWTLAVQLWKNTENEVFILSWDKDLFALVTENVKIYDTMKKKIYGIEETKEKFEVEPKMITDYLAIIWDKSDNIPWIAWFWPKKAVSLINNIWTVEEIYDLIEKRENWDDKELNPEAEKILKWNLLDKLKEAKEIAYLSKKLATLEKDVKLDNFDLKNYKFYPKNILNPEIIEYFRNFEFYSLIWETEEQKDLKTWSDLWLNVKLITDKSWLDNLEKIIDKHDKITLDTETTSLNIIEAELVWVSIYLSDEDIYYINRLHFWEKVNDEDLKLFLSKLLEKDILIVWHNLKYDLEIIELFLKSENLINEEKNLQIWLF